MRNKKNYKDIHRHLNNLNVCFEVKEPPLARVCNYANSLLLSAEDELERTEGLPPSDRELTNMRRKFRRRLRLFKEEARLKRERLEAVLKIIEPTGSKYFERLKLSAVTFATLPHPQSAAGFCNEIDDWDLESIEKEIFRMEGRMDLVEDLKW